MADNNWTRAANVKNTGISKQVYENLGMIDGFFLAPVNQSFATEAVALEKTNWDALIDAAKASRIFPMRDFSEMTPTQEETKYQKFPAGGYIFIAEGNLELMCTVKLSVKAYQKWRSHNELPYRIYFKDKNGNIWAKKDEDDTKVEGFLIDSFRVEAFSFPNSSDTAFTAKVRAVFKNPEELYDRLLIIKPSLATTPWEANDLEGLLDFNMSVTSPTVSGFVLSCFVDGTTDEPVSGLSKDDFTLTDDALGSETITSLTERATSLGVYDAVATLGADGYIITAAAAASLSVSGYEAVAAATFTVTE